VGLGTDTRALERFDPWSGFWERRKPMQLGRRDFETVVLDGYLYVLGGCNPQQHLEGFCTDSVEAYSHWEDTWHMCPPMASERWFFRALALGGWLYALGGEGEDGGSFSTMERYNPNAASGWQAVAPMHYERASFAAEVLGRYIYVAGGIGSDGLPTRTAERYDAAQNFWERLPDMHMDRSHFASVEMHGCLYVLGGKARYDDPALDQEYGQIVAAVERFNPAEGVWEQLSPMRVGRAHFRALEHDGFIYVIGGMAENTVESTAERYNPRIDAWEELPAMRAARCDFAAVRLVMPE
jgi:N-acetylneuraminic acid mutarotase